ncbi:MAG TPA: nitrilase-related carbon-nitrogen hydrolase [Solirubrobacteraceae bacterium]|nr:nitrilase-related carbon-nitrogen hydrolase [Solirubrobacteraceae bacterium]
MAVVRAAAVQDCPVLLDRARTLDLVDRLTDQAAKQGAQLVVFPEAFVPGPPVWIDALPVGGDADWHSLLMRESVTVPGPACDRLAAAADRAGVVLVIGVNEREDHGGTIYNSVLTFGSDGSLLGRHRKLIPTHGERLVWGMGDGSDLKVLDTVAGRLAGLICWENFMPLARFHLYAQGPEVWVAPTLATASSGAGGRPRSSLLPSYGSGALARPLLVVRSGSLERHESAIASYRIDSEAERRVLAV